MQITWLLSLFLIRTNFWGHKRNVSVSKYFISMPFYLNSLFTKFNLNTLNYQSSITINVLNFQTLIACPKGLDKQCRPRSESFFRSSQTRMFPVCYSDNHSVNFSILEWEVFEVWEHLPYQVIFCIHYKNEIKSAKQTPSSTYPVILFGRF